MKRLSIESMGTKVQGVRLRGDRRNPEPEHFRVSLPFGDVDIARTSDDEYWIHVRVNTPDDGEVIVAGQRAGQIKDARIDCKGKHAGTVDASILEDPALFHLAVRVGPR